MTRPKVYGWQGHRAGVGQTREIMVASSQSEVARAVGYQRPGQVFNLTETGNPEEIAQATKSPGKIFYRSMRDDRRGQPWTQADPEITAVRARDPKPKHSPATIYAVYNRAFEGVRLVLCTTAGSLSSNGTFTASDRTGLAFDCAKVFKEGSYALSPTEAVHRFRAAKLQEIAELEDSIRHIRAQLDATIEGDPTPEEDLT